MKTDRELLQMAMAHMMKWRRAGIDDPEIDLLREALARPELPSLDIEPPDEFFEKHLGTLAERHPATLVRSLAKRLLTRPRPEQELICCACNGTGEDYNEGDACQQCSTKPAEREPSAVQQPSDSEIDDVLTSVKPAWWDTPQRATYDFARAILARFGQRQAILQSEDAADERRFVDSVIAREVTPEIEDFSAQAAQRSKRARNMDFLNGFRATSESEHKAEPVVQPEREPRWICLLCKSSRPNHHGTLDDRTTPCPNTALASQAKQGGAA